MSEPLDEELGGLLYPSMKDTPGSRSRQEPSDEDRLGRMFPTTPATKRPPAARRSDGGAARRRPAGADDEDRLLGEMYPSMSGKQQQAERDATYPTMTKHREPEPEPIEPELAEMYPSMEAVPPTEGDPEAPDTDNESGEGPEIPETIDRGSPLFEEFTKTATDLKLPPDAQQQMLGLHQRAIDEQAARWEATLDRWEDEARADRELKQGFEGHLKRADAIIREYGDAEVRELFDVTGAGSHRAVIKMLSRVAKDVAKLMSRG